MTMPPADNTKNRKDQTEPNALPLPYRSMGIPPRPLPDTPVLPSDKPAERYANQLLNQVHVASPCNESWETMPGGAQVRSCARCQHKVYNLSEMTALEAAALIEKAEGRLCVRFYRRADGTMMTKDCPVGARLKRRRMARAGGLGFTALAIACGAGLTQTRDASPPFLRWILNRFDPQPETTTGAMALRPTAVAGGMAFRSLPMAAPQPKPSPTPVSEMGEPSIVMGAPLPLPKTTPHVMGKIAAPRKAQH